MVSEKVVSKNPSGLPLLPAGLLCKEARKFKSSINFLFQNTPANETMVLSVLGACIKCGNELEFICEGEDEKEALAAMIKLVNEGLGE